ncbi:MAG: hypothetical protein ACOX7X_05605 [Methanosarcina flavescens]|uniref:hypothetical protein n=1 Tax=Methanosarcina flavescens TaxID=1715806 RepID=UPI00143557A8|nr:hypothetical protein [Methanosarcina flavescens]
MTRNLCPAVVLPVDHADHAVMTFSFKPSQKKAWNKKLLMVKPESGLYVYDNHRRAVR